MTDKNVYKKLVKKVEHVNAFVLFFEEEKSEIVPINVSKETFDQFNVGKKYKWSQEEFGEEDSNGRR